jgi:hypothetical protein
MGRQEQRLYTVGRFWLARREQSPFFQIRWYDERTKTTRGKSSGCRSLDDAIQAILAHHAHDIAGGRQEPDGSTGARGSTRRQPPIRCACSSPSSIGTA